MAKWDKEKFNSQTPPDNIMCRTCKFRLSPIKVAGYVQDRAGFGKCDQFESKPQDILWEAALCPKFEKG